MPAARKQPSLHTPRRHTAGQGLTLELRSPRIDCAPLIRVAATYVPPMGAILELDIEVVDLRAFDPVDAELLRSRRVWRWMVRELRYVVAPDPNGEVRADAVVVLVAPLLFGLET